jgi:hypothetical protein
MKKHNYMLTVSIYKHFTKPFVYLVWNGENFLGELVEDDIMKLLDKKQVTQFYHQKTTKFQVPMDKLKKSINKPKYMN